MDVRLALYALSARHHLSQPAAARLAELAGLQQTPADLPRRVAQGVLVLAAALGGFGLILWLAANWDDMGRFMRFALLEGLVLVACIGAWLKPHWRAPLGLAALLCTGGLLAYFGQTYQTGADPWQLFAVWAALTLPLCLGSRSDIVWTPWVVVVITAITLWESLRSFTMVPIQIAALNVHLISWLLALGLCAALCPALRRWTCTGIWSWRLAMVFAVFTLTTSAFSGLFSHHMPTLYPLGLIVLAALSLLFLQKRFYDVFALSVTALGLDTVLIFGFYRFSFFIMDSPRSISYGFIFLWVGIFAAGLLAGSVSIILRIHQKYKAHLGVRA